MKLERLTREIREKVKDQLDVEKSTTDDELVSTIEEHVFEVSKNEPLTSTEKKTLVDRVFNSFRGLDILQSLIDDKSITEIMINDYDQIFIEKDGDVFLSDIKFESREVLEDMIQKIVGSVNRQVTEADPIADARLADGSRVNVVLPPIALKGPTMTIRKFPEDPLTIDDMVRFGTVNQEVVDFLRKLVRAKYNIFISGGTSSGKTTFLNVLSDFIPSDERIITIEDSAELQIKNVPNLVSLETRDPNTEGKGEISVRDLIKTSLRMRPNRIIVGEVRSEEALDMLQAMNTGHDGSLSTGHANSTRDMLSRLETMVLSGAELPVKVVRQQMSSAIDIIIHLARIRDSSRKVLEISELTGMEGEEITLNPLYTFVEEGETEDGKVKGRLKPTGNKLQHTIKLQMAGIDL